MGADYNQDGAPSNVLIRGIGNIAAGAAYVIPAGEVLLAVFSVDVDFPDMRVQAFLAAGWRDFNTSDGVLWAGAAGRVVAVPVKIKGDGANYRLQNIGANQIDNVYIVYEL